MAKAVNCSSQIHFPFLYLSYWKPQHVCSPNSPQLSVAGVQVLAKGTNDVAIFRSCPEKEGQCLLPLLTHPLPTGWVMDPVDVVMYHLPHPRAGDRHHGGRVGARGQGVRSPTQICM